MTIHLLYGTGERSGTGSKRGSPCLIRFLRPGRPARTFHEKGHRTRRSRIEIRACNNQGKPKSLGFREDEGRGKVSSFPPISRRSAFALGSYRRASPVAGEELSPVTPRGDRHDSLDCNRPERAA